MNLSHLFLAEMMQKLQVIYSINTKTSLNQYTNTDV